MNDTDRGLGKQDARGRESRALTRRWRGWHTQPHVSQTRQKRGQLTDGCTDARMHRHTYRRQHTNPRTHHTALQTSGRPRDTHARTHRCGPGPHAHLAQARAPGPLRPAGRRWPRSPGVFIYSFVSMNVCTRLLPPLEAGAAAFVPGAGHSPGPASGVPPTLQGRRGLQT